MTDEPRYPRVHIMKVVDHGDYSVSEPLTSPVCDFCGHDSPAWDYDCRDFLVVEDPEISSWGGFAACTPCSNMIEVDDWEGVLERCVAGARRFGEGLGLAEQLAEKVRASAVLVHGYFRENRYGERRAWG